MHQISTKRIRSSRDRLERKIQRGDQLPAGVFQLMLGLMRKRIGMIRRRVIEFQFGESITLLVANNEIDIVQQKARNLGESRTKIAARIIDFQML